MKSEREKRLAGENYRADAAVLAELGETLAWLDRYNAPGLGAEDRTRLLHERLRAVGADVMVRPPFHCDYGAGISLGDGVFLNFGCVLLDVCDIEIGAGTQIGPGVHIYAADHPRDPALRAKGLESGKPVRVGRNVWIGGGAILLPGVTVGDDAIVGAGAVVTRDVPPGATVAGNPARPVRRR